MAADAGGIYVTGCTDGTLEGQTSSGGDDAFLVRFDTAGNLLWIRQFGSAGDDFAEEVAIWDGGVYVVGGADDTLPGQTHAGR